MSTTYAVIRSDGAVVGEYDDRDVASQMAARFARLAKARGSKNHFHMMERSHEDVQETARPPGAGTT